MNVLVIGCGYVGLVVAAGLADIGHHVLNIDIDTDKISKLKNGVIPIVESNLDDLIHRNTLTGNLQFSTSVSDEINNIDVVFICVGTPQDQDGSANLRYVLEVAEVLGIVMENFRDPNANKLMIVDKSTVPVGTFLKVRDVIASKTSRSFDVISNPEFLREGCAVEDFMNPDRIIIGCYDIYAEVIMKKLYCKIIESSNCLWLTMDPLSAELTKYAANAMLAVRISFINEMAALCESVGADIDFVRKGIGSDKRIGNLFLNPGPGFGGSCFPKDLQALLRIGRENAQSLRILEATVAVNNYQKHIMAIKIRKHFIGDVSSIVSSSTLIGRKIAIWGLAFKAHTDDIRESMAIELINILYSLGVDLIVHDFAAMENVYAKIGDKVTYAVDPIEACTNVDALVIATEWPQYGLIDLSILAQKMKSKVIFDSRNLFQPEEMRIKGWIYYSIGRKMLIPAF